MLKKPVILKGDVKEFIELVMNFDAGFRRREKAYYIYPMEVTNFYSQKFEPEMITEYLEMEYDYWFPSSGISLNGKKGIYTFPMPETLSQFITNCIQAGIKLTWKEKE